MFAEFQSYRSFFASHWGIVAGVGLAFFILQVVLSTLLSLRARRHERVLMRLCRDYEQGGDGRTDYFTLPKSFKWLRWVLSMFPAGAASPPANFTRDEALHELDTRIASDAQYLLLQRMGVMAPLLGVILTVVGFYWLRVDESGEQSLQSILLAVTPLVSGVGAGALLALVNQVLLHGVGNRIEKLRMTARSWFDAVIWSHAGLDAQAATLKVVAAMDRFARSVAESADRHAAGSDRLEASTTSMHGAASAFEHIVQSLAGDVKGVPQSLSELRASIAASAAALNDLIPVGARAVANLDVSVAAFRTTVDREFLGAAQLHSRSSKILAESVRDIGEATDMLKAGAGEMKQTAEAGAEAASRLDQSVLQHVVPGNRSFHDAALGLSERVSSMHRVVGALAAQVEGLGQSLAAAAGGLAPAVDAFRDALEHQFTRGVVQHNEHVAAVAASLDQLSATAQGLSEGTTSLQAAMQAGAQLVSESAATNGLIAGAANNLSEVGKDLRRSLEQDVVPSQHVMRDAAAAFAASAADLSRFIEHGLTPATTRLAALHQTLSALEKTVDSISAFSHARPDIDRLTAALSRAAEIADAISALPDQMRDLLEQHVSQAEGQSRGGFRTWLAGRPW